MSVSVKQHTEKLQFRSGDVVSGESEPVEDNRKEPVEFYKTVKLKVFKCGSEIQASVPPFTGIPPLLDVYRERGHRRLDSRAYQAHCITCIWGCDMPVEIIIDQWKPDKVKYRFEAFCYGPKSCSFYKSGKVRTVPGRRGMVWVEEDWIDNDEAEHRGEDE